MLEKIIGATITEMACIGSITSVKSPIAEEGKPKPKKPFINPDIKKVNIKSDILNKSLRLNVSNSAMRSIDKKGSFDQFMKEVKSKYLSDRLKKVKKSILQKSA